MTTIKTDVNGNDYVCRVTAGLRHIKKGKRTYRNWWMVKFSGAKGSCGQVVLNNVIFPKKYIGKKVRFKVEIIE